MNVTRTTATAGTVMIAIVVAAMLGGVRRIAYGRSPPSFSPGSGRS